MILRGFSNVCNIVFILLFFSFAFHNLCISIETSEIVSGGTFIVVFYPSFPSPIKLFSWVLAPDLGLVTLPFALVVYPPPDEIGKACAKHIF